MSKINNLTFSGKPQTKMSSVVTMRGGNEQKISSLTALIFTSELTRNRTTTRGAQCTAADHTTTN